MCLILSYQYMDERSTFRGLLSSPNLTRMNNTDVCIADGWAWYLRRRSLNEIHRWLQYLCIKHKYGWIIIDVIWWTWYIIERLLYAPTTHSSTTGMNTCRWIGQMDVLIRDVQSTSSRGSLINALNISFSRPSFGKNLLVLVHSMLAQQFSRVEARRGSFSTEVTRRPPVLRERIIFLI